MSPLVSTLRAQQRRGVTEDLFDWVRWLVKEFGSLREYPILHGET